jgi:hypothetical protein
VIGDIAIDQVLNGRRSSARALIAGRIDATVNLLAQPLRLLTGASADQRGNGPMV